MQIYDFLVVFPPQQRVLQLVKSADKSERDMFPMDKPYSFLYSVNALSACLREEALEVGSRSTYHG
jgi:ubiquitin carboxyl-terminal hydrolase 34